jgi:hypothetical protein
MDMPDFGSWEEEEYGEEEGIWCLTSNSIRGVIAALGVDSGGCRGEGDWIAL